MDFAQLKIGQHFEFTQPQSRLAAFFTANIKVDQHRYKERGKDTLIRIDGLDSQVHPVDFRTPLTHEELLDYGLEYLTADNEHGETKSGYWMPGDGNGAGYGQFYGETVSAAVSAVIG